jgi:hypothetical protein
MANKQGATLALFAFPTLPRVSDDYEHEQEHE